MRNRFIPSHRSALVFGSILVLIVVLGGCGTNLPSPKGGSQPVRITPALLTAVSTEAPVPTSSQTPVPVISFTATPTLSPTETPRLTATAFATEIACPVGGPYEMAVLADIHPAAQAGQCTLSMPPMENYQQGVLSGYTLTYPQDWRAQVSEDGAGA